MKFSLGVNMSIMVLCCDTAWPESLIVDVYEQQYCVKTKTRQPTIQKSTINTRKIKVVEFSVLATKDWATITEFTLLNCKSHGKTE
jgi:hypothetical protein